MPRNAADELTDAVWGRIIALLEREGLVLVVPRTGKFRLDLKVRVRHVAT